MKHLVSFVLALVGCLILTMSSEVAPKLAVTSAAPQFGPPVSDQPPDHTPYYRKAIPEDHIALPLLSPRIRVRDVVVSNTDPNLTNIDTFGDTEPSIAIDPTNPDQIVITAFSGFWYDASTNAPLWYSGDGGITWTKKFSISPPPNVPEAIPNCPCDQTVDYGRGSILYGTFLTGHFLPPPSNANVYSGSTIKPLKPAFWHWLISGGTAQRTNLFGFHNADQPQVLVTLNPGIPSQDKVYVGYDDFLDFDQRVSTAVGVDPPAFNVDNQTGTGTCCVNPGHRLAVNPNNGYIYSIFQQYNGGSANINYFLNRSTDGGVTWGVNGSPNGIIVANADSTQPTPKFGTVNALLGGVDHATVDPTNGDVYYVYGNRDPSTGNNRLSIARLQDNGAGGMTLLSTTFVTGQVQAALPSIAVNTNGAIGVLYDTFDAFSAGFPQFTAHFATSTDHGLTFLDSVLETFLSPFTDNGDSLERVLRRLSTGQGSRCCFQRRLRRQWCAVWAHALEYRSYLFQSDIMKFTKGTRSPRNHVTSFLRGERLNAAQTSGGVGMTYLPSFFLVSLLLINLAPAAYGVSASLPPVKPRAIQSSESTPNILYAQWIGKNLSVQGENFADGAALLVDGQRINTSNDATSPRFFLFAKKARKKVPRDQAIKLQVQNPTGEVSNEFAFYSGFIITMRDAGSLLHLNVGDRFLLFLYPDGEPATLGWAVSLGNSPPPILNRITDDLPIPSAQGFFEAVRPGTVSIDAQGHPLCPPLPPEICERPSGIFFGFSMGVVVE
jgi:hypothetical protein